MPMSQHRMIYVFCRASSCLLWLLFITFQVNTLLLQTYEPKRCAQAKKNDTKNLNDDRKTI